MRKSDPTTKDTKSTKFGVLISTGQFPAACCEFSWAESSIPRSLLRGSSFDPATGKFELKVALNVSTDEINEFLQEYPYIFAHVVFASKPPLWVADALNDPRCPDPEFYRRLARRPTSVFI